MGHYHGITYCSSHSTIDGTVTSYTATEEVTHYIESRGDTGPASNFARGGTGLRIAPAAYKNRSVFANDAPAYDISVDKRILGDAESFITSLGTSTSNKTLFITYESSTITEDSVVYRNLDHELITLQPADEKDPHAEIRGTMAIKNGNCCSED